MQTLLINHCNLFPLSQREVLLLFLPDRWTQLIRVTRDRKPTGYPQPTMGHGLRCIKHLHMTTNPTSVNPIPEKNILSKTDTLLFIKSIVVGSVPALVTLRQFSPDFPGSPCPVHQEVKPSLLGDST